jgi:hypothetical protein
MKRFLPHTLASIAALSLMAAVVFAQKGAPNGQNEPGSKPIKMFMQLKLEPAKQILEGIATEDYDLINRSAQRIRTLTLDENWMTIQTPEYKQQSKDFQRSIAMIADAAKEKNIDRATLGYVQMTLNCVQCHRGLRK